MVEGGEKQAGRQGWEEVEKRGKALGWFSSARSCRCVAVLQIVAFVSHSALATVWEERP
jgi:hypothetical protein